MRDVENSELSTTYYGHIDSASALPKLYPQVSVTVLAVTGELNADTSGQLAHDLRRCAAVQRPMIVDLRILDFFDTPAVHVLISFERRCRARGVPLVLVTCPMVDRRISTTDAGRFLRRVGSIRAALWRLRGDVLRSGQRRMPLATREALQC